MKIKIKLRTGILSEGGTFAATARLVPSLDIDLEPEKLKKEIIKDIGKMNKGLRRKR
jgi:hypothetical protein